MTKGQIVAADIAALLRARNPLLWVTTREEARVERFLVEAGAAAQYAVRAWDCDQGIVEYREGGEKPMPGAGNLNDPRDALMWLKARATGSQADRCALIMRDLPVWLAGPPGAVVLRSLRNLARLLPTMPRDRAQAIIVLTPSGEVPAELAGLATVIDWPLPDREEVAAIYDAQIEVLPDDLKAGAAANGTRDAAIDAAIGLSGKEAGDCFAKSLVQLRKIDVPTIAAEKKRVITRERVLEWMDPLSGGLAMVGGLDALKSWVKMRTMAYSPAARAYGLPAPKGVLLGGLPGNGKTLLAKALSWEWSVPLLKFDLGALKSKFVGESEGNMRKAQNVIGAIGRCVVLIDEIEKGLQGATSGAADGGVSADALGSLLSWMQDRKTEAFIVATANNVEALPAELLRKGRFDECWWIDLPSPVERAAIINVSLRQFKRSSDAWKGAELARLVDATEGFSGSEIAALVPEAMFAAFADGAREITAGDLLEVAASVKPLSVTAKGKIDALREWAKGKMRPASSASNVVELRRAAAPALDL